MAISISRGQAVALATVLLVALVMAGRRLADAGTVSERPAAASVLRPVAAAPAKRFVVHVVGAVRNPGLYGLRDGSRVADAIARAGGATPQADLAAVNLAAPVADGSQVLLPARTPPGAPAAPAGATATVPAKVSLASATLEQLDTLPGVGPVTAHRILEHRDRNGPFRSVDDLDAVPGIGPARIEQLRELVTP